MTNNSGIAIIGAAIVAAFALSRIGSTNKVEARQDAATDRTAIRQDEQTARVEIRKETQLDKVTVRQEEKTARVEARAQAVSNVLGGSSMKFQNEPPRGLNTLSDAVKEDLLNQPRVRNNTLYLTSENALRIVKPEAKATVEAIKTIQKNRVPDTRSLSERFASFSK